MNKAPLVSVIVTTKNESRNLKRYFESISSQTYKNIEMILVDNNSTDKTKTLAKKYTKKVYNFGPERSAQRNHGADKSSGEYLLFLDADMELSSTVIAECVELAKKKRVGIITIPETTVGKGLIPRVRKFEREMYFGEADYEVPRFFDKKIFFEHGGYDINLTGPEDYDLPYRMGKGNKFGRISSFLYHHEQGLTLKRLLAKKYYYAKKGAAYAVKHPRLVKVQGTILFRKVYLKNWKKFLAHPILGISFIVVRLLETLWAVSGFISAVGILGFLKTLVSLIK